MGALLKYNAPLEYYLIIEVGGHHPSADLIENVGYASLNDLFKGSDFRLALIEYRKNGLWIPGFRRKPIPESLIKQHEENMKALQEAGLNIII